MKRSNKNRKVDRLVHAHASRCVWADKEMVRVAGADDAILASRYAEILARLIRSHPLENFRLEGVPQNSTDN